MSTTIISTVPRRKYNVIDWRIRFWAKVKKTETCWLWESTITKHGYGHFRIDGTQRPAHRVSYADEFGPIPPNTNIDHLCHVRHCVRPSHLRLATQKQNIENQSGLMSTNKSGHRGVHWNPRRNKWNAIVKHNGKSYYCGIYADLHEAAEAAKLKRIELFTHNDEDRGSSVEN